MDDFKALRFTYILSRKNKVCKGISKKSANRPLSFFELNDFVAKLLAMLTAKFYFVKLNYIRL